MIGLSFINCVLLVSLWQVPSSKEWRGLSPLKSTRADVERMLGQPDDNYNNKLVTYYLPEQVVSFGFRGNPKCQEKSKSITWDVKGDSYDYTTHAKATSPCGRTGNRLDETHKEKRRL